MNLQLRVALGMVVALVLCVVAVRFVVVGSVRDAQIELALVTMAIVLVTSLLVVVPLSRRLRVLERVTQKLRAGDLSARVDIDGGGAVASLATNINHMAEEIERHVDNQKQLLQAVSHEFRTPTARIRFSLELLETAEDPEARGRHVEAIDKNLNELDSLVEELLAYARFDDAGSPQIGTESIDVGEVVDELVAAAQVVSERITVSAVAHPGGATRILANRRYARRAIDNLLRNAIRHADSKVSVEYQRVGNHVLLFVNDDGAGVPKAERDRVWEPFARVDLSRSRDSGGFGLGLAIVRRIMAWHGGRAHIEDSLLGGAMFVTHWPVDPAFAEPEDEGDQL